jgi:hypothetical protein
VHERAGEVARDAVERYRATTGLTPAAFVVEAADGASIDER